MTPDVDVPAGIEPLTHVRGVVPKQYSLLSIPLSKSLTLFQEARISMLRSSWSVTMCCVTTSVIMGGLGSTVNPFEMLMI